MRPGGEWRGKGLSARGLGTLLKRYGIRSGTVWLENESAKGYKREDFEDAWRRYLPSETSGPSGSAFRAGSSHLFNPSEEGHLTDTNEAANTHEQTDLTDLTDGTPETGAQAR
jgi:hypothetical protein